MPHVYLTCDSRVQLNYSGTKNRQGQCLRLGTQLVSQATVSCAVSGAQRLRRPSAGWAASARQLRDPPSPSQPRGEATEVTDVETPNSYGVVSLLVIGGLYLLKLV